MRSGLLRRLANDGQDLLIARAGDPGGYDENQEPIPGPANAVSVRGILYQLDAQEAGARGAQVGVPLWEAILPWYAPVREPGFTIERLVNGVTEVFNPIGVAQDYGDQGVAWSLTLSAPDRRAGP